MISEAQLIAAFGLPDAHCISCHEDADGFGMYMTTVELDEGWEIEVCCDVQRAWVQAIEKVEKGGTAWVIGSS